MTMSNVAGQPVPGVEPGAITNFADVPLHGAKTAEPATEAAVAEHIAAAAAAHGYTAEQLDWATPRASTSSRSTSPPTVTP